MDRNTNSDDLKRFLALRLFFSVAVTSGYLFYKTQQSLKQNIGHLDLLVIELSRVESKIGIPIGDSVVYDLLTTNEEFRKVVNELQMNSTIPRLKVSDSATNIVLKTTSLVKIPRGGAKYNKPTAIYQKPNFIIQLFNLIKTSVVASVIFNLSFGLTGIFVQWMNGQLEPLKNLSNAELVSLMDLLRDTRRDKRLWNNFFSRIQLLFNRKLWEQLKSHTEIIIKADINFNRLQYIILNLLELCPPGMSPISFISMLIVMTLIFGTVVALKITSVLLFAPAYCKILFLGMGGLFFTFDYFKLDAANLKLLFLHLSMLIDGASNFSKIEDSNHHSSAQHTELIHENHEQPLITPEPAYQLPESKNDLEWPTIESSYPDAIEIVREALENGRQKQRDMVKGKEQFDRMMYEQSSPPPQIDYKEPPK